MKHAYIVYSCKQEKPLEVFASYALARRCADKMNTNVLYKDPRGYEIRTAPYTPGLVLTMVMATEFPEEVLGYERALLAKEEQPCD